MQNECTERKTSRKTMNYTAPELTCLAWWNNRKKIIKKNVDILMHKQHYRLSTPVTRGKYCIRLPGCWMASILGGVVVGGNSPPPPKFLVSEKCRQIFLSKYFLPKIQNLQLRTADCEKLRDKNWILNTCNLLCWKFVTSCPLPTF